MEEKRLDRAYLVSIALNAGFVILEVVVALIFRSLGLLSDAGHKLIDVNALILLVAVVIIICESIGKFSSPEPVNGAAISWTAGVGILVSGLSAWLLMRHREDINTRAAFLHMATDSLLSLGVVISGIVISLTGLHVIDPVVSLVIAAVILFNTVRLLRDALRTLLKKQ